MPFPFAYVCDLLQQVADQGPAERQQKDRIARLIRAWFEKHRALIDGLSKSDGATGGSRNDGREGWGGAALLATLVPDYRTDRVYGLQVRSLEKIIARALCLGRSRMLELSRWTRPNENGTAVDLGDCVEGILERTPNPIHPGAAPVTVEEIDSLLHAVAGHCRFSSPAVREGLATGSSGSSASSAAPRKLASFPRERTIGQLFRRLPAREAKWFTRLILKDYRPVVLDTKTIFRAFHPRLPMALCVYTDLATAVCFCRQEDTQSDEATAPAKAVGPGEGAKPRLGVKVGRQRWAKARSIRHCVDMVGLRRMSCEKKLDGEYVQIHVDLSKGVDNCLRFFSKSGKDSTRDRIQLHDIVRESLRTGKPDCPIKTGCILEGEMLAYDERTEKIMDFDSIRRHITRSGTALFCHWNREGEAYEHLMIVYFDLLLVDDESLLGVRHCERFERLERLIQYRKGYAEIVPRQVINFGQQTAAAQLRQAFAQCIASRQEGLVLKADDEPYFDMAPSGTAPRKPFLYACAIKLKKEYVGGFGEVGDFAILGARYDAATAKEYSSSLPPLRRTHFYIGCLANSPKASGATSQRPERGQHTQTPAQTQRQLQFIVTNVVTLPEHQMATFLKHCQPMAVRAKVDRQQGGRILRVLEAEAGPLPFNLSPMEPGLDNIGSGPSELFTQPPIVEIRCFSFHRPGYGKFWSPRFPSISKFHFDRTYRDALTFDELQAMATEESRQRSCAAEAEAAEEETDGDENWDRDPSPASEWLMSEQDFRRRDAQKEARQWVDELKRADSGGIAVDAETSQSSGSALTAASQVSIVTISSTSAGDIESGSQVTAAAGDAATDKDEEGSRPEAPVSPLLFSTPNKMSQQDGTSTASLADDSQGSDGGDEGNDGDSGSKNHGRDGSGTAKKRARHWEEDFVFPIVSPPQLRRLSSRP